MSWNSTTMIAVGALVVVVGAGIAYLFARRQRARGSSGSSPYVEGLMRLIAGDYASAFEHLQKAVRSGNAPADAYIRLGRMLRERGEAGKALQIHKGLTVKADLTRTEKIDLFVNIAEDYAALGRPEQAVNVLDNAASRLGLRESPVQRILARESHRMGSFERAYAYLRELKKTGEIGEPDLAAYLAEAGSSLLKSGDEREAKRTLQRSLKHDDECASAHMALGDLAGKSGDDNEAIERWRAAARLSSSFAPRALSQLERVTFGRGTFSQMEDIYRQVLATRTDDEGATLSLASFLRKQGRDGEATQLLEEFHDRHPMSVGAMVLLMSLYFNSGSDQLEHFLQTNEERFVHGATDGEPAGEAESMPWR